METTPEPTTHTVLITGAAGFIGRRLLRLLHDEHPQLQVIATARRKPELDLLDQPGSNVRFMSLDVRSVEAIDLLRQQKVDTVVHLASVVTPGPGMDRHTMHDIDVGGTRNMLEASVAADVKKFIVTTSAASYGYHADNPVPLTENDALRGNTEFAYSDHKRQVEDLLADFRDKHPELSQLVFRPGFILGPDCENQITALFNKPVILGIRGSETPFTIIWDEDVARCIARGIVTDKTGIYNQAGDGVVTFPEMAQMLGKPFVAVPVSVVKSALWLFKRLGVSQYGPEQVNFLRYRPVLSNRALKEDFGYTPGRTSLECFLEYTRGRGLLKNEPVNP